MQKKQTPLESPQKPQTRTRNPVRTPRTTININTSNNDDSGQPETQPEQPTHTPEPTPPTQPETPSKPLIYAEPQRLQFPNGDRENLYATPLAATLLARFNPDDPREQPFEHAIFIDHRLKQRGFI